MMHRAFRTIVVLLGLSVFLLGCDSSSRLVVTADWLNQSLTLFDYDRLIDGQSDASQAIVDTIDLSAWEPGPIELEITPDGKTAVVSVGPAFFDGTGVTNTLIGSPEVPPGGALLIVGLESGEATEVATDDVPLGIAISSSCRQGRARISFSSMLMVTSSRLPRLGRFREAPFLSPPP